MILQRFFSQKPTVDDHAANTMETLGKAGLGVAGGVGAASLVQAGRAAVLVPQVASDAKAVMKLRKDKVIRNAVKQGIDDAANHISIVPGVGEKIKNRIKDAERIYDNTKFSKLDRLQKMVGLGNTLSKQNRTVLSNMGNWAEAGSQQLLKNVAVNPQQQELINRGVRSVDRLGRFGLRVKNAKTLGKVALGLGAASGAAYLRGKELQSYQSAIRNNNNVKNEKTGRD